MVERLVTLGRIVGAHGVRGAVKLLPYNPDSATLPRLTRAVLRRADGTTCEVTVRSSVRRRNLFLLELAEVASREAAQDLRGAEVAVPRSTLPALAPGESYIADLIGLPVVTEDGRTLGVLADVMETGANDVLVVRRGRREILLPDIPDVVLARDPLAGRIVVRLLPGLADG